MRTTQFEIPLYKVDILLVQAESLKETDTIISTLEDFGVKCDNSLREIKENLNDALVNGGVTFRYLIGKKIAVLFYMFDSPDEMINTYAHEKRHAEDRILDYFSVNDSESAAMLAGFLAEKFMEFGKKTYRKLKRNEKNK